MATDREQLGELFKRACGYLVDYRPQISIEEQAIAERVRLEIGQGDEPGQQVVTVVHLESGQRSCAGKLTETAPGRWNLAAESDHKGPLHVLGDSFDFEADGEAAIVAAILQRAKAVQIVGERLENQTTALMVAQLLQPLNSVAAETGSMPGYLDGLTVALSHFLAEDVKPENRADLMAAVSELALGKAADIAERQERARVLLESLASPGGIAEKLEKMLGVKIEPDEGEDTPAAQ